MTLKFNTISIHRLLALSIIISLSLLNLGFVVLPSGQDHSAGECALPGENRQIRLDGVDVSICLPFSPDIFIAAGENDLVQSAYAANRNTGQEFSLYVVPYGLQPAADNLPVSKPNIASLYQDLSFKVYKSEILADVEMQPANLFGQTISSRAVVINSQNSNIPLGQQMIIQWIVEAGQRVWLLRLTQRIDTYLSTISPAIKLDPITLTSSNLYQPSTSLKISREPLPAETTAVTPSATDLPFPSWWNGDCDVNGFPGSYPLGASFRGVKTCGPLSSMHLVRFQPGFVGQYEWQCVEYVKRYMYLAYGIPPYLANGDGVVKNYTGTRLEKVLNGTANKGPFPGDVISYNGPSTYGHTSLVTAATIDGNGNGSITIAEQNYSKTGTRTHTVSNWYINSSDGVYGWLHDKEASDNPPADFIKCADQGKLCTFTGTAEVVYGARSSFTNPRIFKNSVDCNNVVFGDPIGGVAKSCYYKTTTTSDLTSWATKYYSGSEHWSDNNSTSGKMCEEIINSYGLDKNYGAAAPCGNGVLDDWVAEYNATVTFAPGNYIFQAQNDNGVKVWVNGQNIFDRSASTGLSSSCPAINLNGSASIRVILREETDNARIRLLWTTDPGTCTPPGSFGKAAPGNQAVQQPLSKVISWTPSQNVVSYYYCIDTSDNDTCDTTWQKTGNLIKRAVSGLAYNETYYWQVKAVNSAGEIFADNGTWWSFTTIPDPAACYPLTLSHSGNGADPVATPANADGCSDGQYHAGDNITLTANPDIDQRVKNWNGTNDDASKDITNALTMPAETHAASVNYEVATIEVPVLISPSGLVTNDYHPIYTWYAAPTATSYLLTVYNEDLTSYVFNAKIVPASYCKGTPVICSYHPNVPLGNYNYGFKVAAVNATTTTDYSPWISFFIGKRAAVFKSIATQDGFIRESTETSNLGGLLNTASTELIIGDDAVKRQYRSIISFDTSGLPDNAVILSASFSLTKVSVTGVDPFTTHGLMVADISNPYFGSSLRLQLPDFAAAAMRNRVAVVKATSVQDVYTATLAKTAFNQINKFGFTQFRLRFDLDDDNDAVADYIKFYSGQITTDAYRPVLNISYYVP